VHTFCAPYKKRFHKLCTIIFSKGFFMNHVIVIASFLSVLALSACDKQPVVVNVPTPVAVPGPAGPQGATGTAGTQGNQGNPGYDGAKGDTGKTGGTTAVIIMPTASEPAK
jgi:hypothetical protein